MQNVVSGITFEIMIFISGTRSCLSVCSTARRSHKKAKGHQRRCAFGVENIAHDLVRGRTTSQTRTGAKRMRKGACEGFRSELQFAPVEDHLRSLLLLASCELSDASGSHMNRQSR